MAYKRQIAYFDVIEDETQKGNAGFCKWEEKRGTHTIRISINGKMTKETVGQGVYTKSGICLGKLIMQNGRAEGIYHLEGEEQDWNRELVRIRISLSCGGELEAVFREEQADLKNQEMPILENQESPVDWFIMGNREISIEQVMVDNRHIPAESEVVVNSETVVNPEVQDKSENDIKQEKAVLYDSIDSITEEKAAEGKQPIGLWDSLATTNDTMRPFGTEEEYYRIALEDIYRLKEEYHLLRNNQFLLHGYYNYHYLILGKKEAEEEKYWLGVPGIYHEREKMAARMYGFEKFEGKKRNYGVGDLGYYLISAE